MDSVGSVYKNLKMDSEAEATSDSLPPIDPRKGRFPCCVVWTPIPLLTWFFPIIGHMGIGMSNGIIRDFAGPYFVSEDNMAFGKPTKYWQLHPSLARDGVTGWDRAVSEASEVYKHRMHNLLCDNCHSHVATALNIMHYKGSIKWNMVMLAVMMMLHAKYVGCAGVVKTWLPFLCLTVVIGIVIWVSVSY